MTLLGLAKGSSTRRRGDFRKALALVAISAVMLGCQNPANRVSEERVVRFFDDLVFGVDFALDRPRLTTIRKWDDMIRVHIADDVTETRRSIVEAKMGRMAALTGTRFEILDAESADITLKIRFDSTADFLADGEYVPCIAWVSRGVGAIEEANVVVSTANESIVEECVVHELEHAFGILNHSPILNSVMSPLHREKQLTVWDEIVLRVLYDRRLKSGFSRDEALPIARKAIGEIMSTLIGARWHPNPDRQS